MTLLFRNIGKSSASTHLVVIEKRIRTREANKFRFRFPHVPVPLICWYYGGGGVQLLLCRTVRPAATCFGDRGGHRDLHARLLRPRGDRFRLGPG